MFILKQCTHIYCWKYCPSLYFLPSCGQNTDSVLEKFLVLWSDSRIDQTFSFLVRMKMLISQVIHHRTEQIVIRIGNIWRIRGWCKISHLKISKYELTICETCGQTLSCCKITLSHILMLGLYSLFEVDFIWLQ